MLLRFARIDYDPVRQRRVLLYPEGAVMLNDTAAEILALCDGRRTIDDIASTLGEKYHADVTDDVLECLVKLGETELVRDLSV
jgi:pyrroloquinoline quinone biosynthesis protein D